MDLSDDDGAELFEKVLKLQNEDGVITAFQCLLHKDEASKAEPMEQNCVPIARLTEAQINAFADRKANCYDIDSEMVFVGSLIVLLAGMVTAAGGTLVVAFIDSLPVGRFAVVPALLAMAGAGYWYYQSSGSSCNQTMALITRRLWDEINKKVPADHARVLPVNQKIWAAFDAITTTK